MRRFTGLLLLSLGLCPQPLRAELRLFIGDSRHAFVQSESFPVGFWSSEPVSGELTLTAQPLPSGELSVLLKQNVKLGAGETLLWDVQPQGLQAGTYRLAAQLSDQTATLDKLSIMSSVPKSSFLVGAQVQAEDNAQDGATWSGLGLYIGAKLDADGRLVADPLIPSPLDRGADQVVSQGQRAYIWHGLWGGFIVHQLYTYHTSYNDPELTKVALQRAEIGAQQARRFLPILVSFGGNDEAGLGYGIIPDGKLAGSAASTFPDVFQRAAYEKESGATLLPDPRQLPDEAFVKWFRWRAGLMQRFFTEAKRHVKRVDARLPWGQDVYASMFANDGPHPFGNRMNDLPTTHTFMFWFGPPEMHWNFALERTARRDKRFHFAANANTWGNNKPDEALLAEMVANYVAMEGAGMLWYLSMNSHTNMAVTYPRLHRYVDFINATLPDVAPVGVLFSFNEISLRCKEAGDVPSDAYYTISNDHGYPIGATFRALRRAGYFADYVHEEEIPEGGLKGRQVLWLVGIRHRLAPDVLAGLEKFVKEGGRICCDATTDVKAAGLDEKSVTQTTVDYSGMNQWRLETQNHAAKLLERVSKV